MKKLLLLVLFGAFATAVSAQFLIGGHFNITSFKDEEKTDVSIRESNTTRLTLLPRLAYASGNLWYGVDAGVNTVKSKYTQGIITSETRTAITTIAPFIRYIKRPVANFGLWIEGQAGASFGNEKTGRIKTIEYSGFNVGLRPGVIFFIGSHLSFEASFGSLGYSSLTITKPSSTQQKDTFTQLGLILNGNALSPDNTIAGFSSGFLFGANWLF